MPALGPAGWTLLWFLASALFLVWLYRRRRGSLYPSPEAIRECVAEFRPADLRRIRRVVAQHGFSVPGQGAHYVFAAFSLLQGRPAARVDVNEPLSGIYIDSLSSVDFEIEIAAMCGIDSEAFDVETRFRSTTLLCYLEVLTFAARGRE